MFVSLWSKKSKHEKINKESATRRIKYCQTYNTILMFMQAKRTAPREEPKARFLLNCMSRKNMSYKDVIMKCQWREGILTRIGIEGGEVCDIYVMMSMINIFMCSWRHDSLVVWYNFLESVNIPNSRYQWVQWCQLQFYS